MGRDRSRRLVEESLPPLSFKLPVLTRRRPRDFEEWRALKRWGRLPRQEETVPGFLLRQAREEANLSQKQLAERLGCSQQAVSQAERWQSNPTVGFMESWARETGCELNLELRPRSPSGSVRETQL